MIELNGSGNDVPPGGMSVTSLVPDHTGLTAAERERLVCLIEEASEVIKDASKALRHGLDSYDPNTGRTNRQALAKEVGNLNQVLRYMLHSSDIPQQWIDTGSSIKELNWQQYTYYQPESNVRKEA